MKQFTKEEIEDAHLISKTVFAEQFNQWVANDSVMSKLPQLQIMTLGARCEAWHVAGIALALRIVREADEEN